MADSGREARRRRILKGGQDRLALITGRKPNLSSDANDSDTSPPYVAQQFHQDLRSNLPFDQPSVSEAEEDKSSYFMRDQASNISHDGAIGGLGIEEPFLRKSEPVTEPSRASASVENSKREASSGVQKVFDAALGIAQQIPVRNITSQQVSVAVAETEHDRLLCALTIAILVVLSSAGFPIVGSKIFRWILLFRPLMLVLITNITLISRRLLPDNRKNLVRGEKDNKASLLGDGYAWAEEAGRALELGLMLQNLSGALFMDCSVYAAIVVFGLSLFG
uniref:Uncharacterized protein n=1 Tax=Beta vulgaris TaxID=161934 RepID=G9FIF0_BETVU|nr:hypothetical protein [Beta vulgaris]